MANGAATYEQRSDQSSLVPQAVSDCYAAMIAAIMSWCAGIQQYTSAWYTFVITTLFQWYTNSLDFVNTWYTYTIATLISYYTYYLDFAFEGYYELKGHTAVTDYYAVYYKQQFLQRCTETKASLLHKEWCSFGGQWTLRVMFNIAIWIVLPPLLLVITKKYMSSRVLKVLRALYVFALLWHLALMSCIGEIVLTVFCILLFMIIVGSNRAALSAHLESLAGRLGRFIDRWAFRPINHTSYRFRRMFTQVFLPWVTATVWRYVLTPIRDCWLSFSEPVDPNFTLKEDPPFTWPDPPRSNHPTPTVTGKQPDDNTWGSQSSPGTTLPDGTDTGPVGRSIRAPGYSDDENSSSEDGNKGFQTGQITTKLLRQVTEFELGSKPLKNSGYKKPKPDDPMEVFDSGTRKNKASWDKKEAENLKKDQDNVQKGEEARGRTRSIVQNDQDIEAYNNDIKKLRESHASPPTEASHPTKTSSTEEQGNKPTDDAPQPGLPQHKGEVSAPAAQESAPNSSQPNPTSQNPSTQDQPPISNSPPPAQPPDTRASDPLPGPTPFNRPNLLNLSEYAPHVRTTRPTKGADSVGAYTDRVLGGGSLLTQLRLQRERKASEGGGGDGSGGGGSGSGGNDGDQGGDQGDDGKDKRQDAGEGDKGHTPDDSNDKTKDGDKVNTTSQIPENANQNTPPVVDTEGAKDAAILSEKAQGKQPIGVDATPNIPATTTKAGEQHAQPNVEGSVKPDATSDVTDPNAGAKVNAADNGTENADDDEMSIDSPDYGGGKTKDGHEGAKKPDENDPKENGEKNKDDDSDSNQEFEPVIGNEEAGRSRSGGASTTQGQMNDGAASAPPQNPVPNLPTQGLGLPTFTGQKTLPGFDQFSLTLPALSGSNNTNPPAQGQGLVPDLPTQDPAMLGSGSGSDRSDIAMHSDAGSDDSTGLGAAVRDALEAQAREANSTTQNGPTGAAQPNQNRVPSKEDEPMEDAPRADVTNSGSINTGGNNAPQHVPSAAGNEGDEMDGVTTTDGNINSAPQNPVLRQFQNTTTSNGSQKAQQTVSTPGLNGSSYSGNSRSQPPSHNNAGSAPRGSSTQPRPPQQTTPPASSTKHPPLFSGINLPAIPPPQAAPETGFLDMDHTMDFGSGAPAKTTTATTPTATAPSSTPLADTVQHGNGIVRGPGPALGIQRNTAAAPASNSSANPVQQDNTIAPHGLRAFDPSRSSTAPTPKTGRFSLFKGSNFGNPFMPHKPRQNGSRGYGEEDTAPGTIPGASNTWQSNSRGYDEATAPGVPVAPEPTAKAPASTPFANVGQQGGGLPSGLTTASGLQTTTGEAGPTEPPIDHQALQDQVDKQLADLVGDDSNTSNTTGRFGGPKNAFNTSTDLTGQPRNAKDISTTKPAARPAKGSVKKANPFQKLVDYPSSGDEDEPKADGTDESDNLSLNSEEKKGLTDDQIAFNDQETQKHLDFLAAMTPEERDEYERQAAEIRLRGEVPPRISSSDGSEANDGIIHTAPLGGESSDPVIDSDLDDQIEAMKTQSSDISILSSDPDPPSAGREQAILDEIKKNNDKREWDGETPQEKTAEQEAAIALRPKAPTKPKRATTSNQNKPLQTEDTPMTAVPQATLSPNMDEDHDSPPAPPVKKGKKDTIKPGDPSRKATAEQMAKRKVAPLRKTPLSATFPPSAPRFDQNPEPTRPHTGDFFHNPPYNTNPFASFPGSAGTTAQGSYSFGQNNAAAAQPSTSPGNPTPAPQISKAASKGSAGLVSQPTNRHRPGDVYVFENPKKGNEEFAIQSSGKNLYLDIPRFGRAYWDNDRGDWYVKDSNLAHQVFSIMKKSQVSLWVEGHDPAQAPADSSGEPYPGEVWVWDDDSNGYDDEFVVESRKTEDGTELFIDRGDLTEVVWDTEFFAWADENGLLDADAELITKAKREERERLEMEEQQQQEGQDGHNDDGMEMDDTPQQQQDDEPTFIDDINPRPGTVYVFEDHFVNGTADFEVQTLDEESAFPTLFLAPSYDLRFIWNRDRTCWETEDEQPVPEDKKFMPKEEWERRNGGM